MATIGRFPGNGSAFCRNVCTLDDIHLAGLRCRALDRRLRVASHLRARRRERRRTGVQVKSRPMSNRGGGGGVGRIGYSIAEEKLRRDKQQAGANPSL